MSFRSPPHRVRTAGATTGFLGTGDPRLAGFLPVRALAANRNKRHSITPELKPDRIRQFPERPSIQRDHAPCATDSQNCRILPTSTPRNDAGRWTVETSPSVESQASERPFTASTVRWKTERYFDWDRDRSSAPVAIGTSFRIGRHNQSPLAPKPVPAISNPPTLRCTSIKTTPFIRFPGSASERRHRVRQPAESAKIHVRFNPLTATSDRNRESSDLSFGTAVLTDAEKTVTKALQIETANPESKWPPTPTKPSRKQNDRNPESSKSSRK